MVETYAMDHCYVGGLLHWDSTVFEVPPEEAEGSISLSSDLLDMFSPGKIILDGDSQVFA